MLIPDLKSNLKSQKKKKQKNVQEEVVVFFWFNQVGNVFGTFNENTIGTKAKQKNSLVFINELCVVFHGLAQQYESIFFGQKNVRYFQ